MPRLSGSNRSTNIAAVPSSLSKPSQQCLTHSTWRDTSLELFSASTIALALGSSSWIRSMCFRGSSFAARYFVGAAESSTVNARRYVRHPTQIRACAAGNAAVGARVTIRAVPQISALLARDVYRGSARDWNGCPCDLELQHRPVTRYVNSNSKFPGARRARRRADGQAIYRGSMLSSVTRRAEPTKRRQPGHICTLPNITSYLKHGALSLRDI